MRKDIIMIFIFSFAIVSLLPCSDTMVESLRLRSYPIHVHTLSSTFFPSQHYTSSTPCLQRQGQYRHYFQKKDDSGATGGGNENKEPPYLSRFVPGIFKKKMEKPETETDTSMRYELRLKNVDVKNRRHVTTRLQRYLPDLQFETAQEIVDIAIESELG